MNYPINTLFDALAIWSDKTFGTPAERGPAGCMKHLQKEAQEALEKPGDVMEYVDCLFLSLDGARRAGFTIGEIIAAAWAKLAILQDREYPDPKTQPADAFIEHIRSDRIGGTDSQPIIRTEVRMEHRIDGTTQLVTEQVDHPSHYGGADDPFEVIKVIEAWDLGFSLGSALKYIRRRREKGDELTNLKKARWCIDREIQRLST